MFDGRVAGVADRGRGGAAGGEEGAPGGDVARMKPLGEIRDSLLRNPGFRFAPSGLRSAYAPSTVMTMSFSSVDSLRNAISG
jgi:hypothetical protein